jgi:hypothetical protein
MQLIILLHCRRSADDILVFGDMADRTPKATGRKRYINDVVHFLLNSRLQVALQARFRYAVYRATRLSR